MTQTAATLPRIPLTHTPSLLNDALRLLCWCADGLDVVVPSERVMIRCSFTTHTADTPVVVLRSVLREMGGQVDGRRTIPTAREDVTTAIVARWASLSPARRTPADEVATVEQRRDLARHISQLAEVLANGTVTGPEYAAVGQLAERVALLQAWTPDDRR